MRNGEEANSCAQLGQTLERQYQASRQLSRSRLAIVVKVTKIILMQSEADHVDRSS